MALGKREQRLLVADDAGGQAVGDSRPGEDRVDLPGAQRCEVVRVHARPGAQRDPRMAVLEAREQRLDHRLGVHAVAQPQVALEPALRVVHSGGRGIHRGEHRRGACKQRTPGGRRLDVLRRPVQQPAPELGLEPPDRGAQGLLG